ncbi:MAG: hypothetical protein ACO1G9_10520 [Bacteroidota bacterium]
MEKGGGRSSKFKKKDPHPSYSISKSKSSALFDECDLISIETIIVNPTAAIGSLNEGDILSIQLNKRILSAFNGMGEFCGNIVTIILEKIIECIKKGRSFIGIVNSIENRSCKITIQVL